MRWALVTGGCGFIGSAVVRWLLADGWGVINLDLLTYAANRAAAEPPVDAEQAARYAFVQADICDAAALDTVFARHRPQAVVHLAAETHVDRSIDGPERFVETNAVGTARLLEAARRHWNGLNGDERADFRLLHVSTDEVFGSLGATGHFSERSPYAPRSPYAASKAAADHLVRAWHETYGLPVLITNCSNNYGPWQFPEKLIPLIILKGLHDQPMPVYGDGANVRDWLHVDDHAAAIALVLTGGRVGETYLVGGGGERSNLAVVRTICAHLDTSRPQGAPHARLITFVADRPGHDHRYAIDGSHLRNTLGWAPRESFESGLAATVRWYVENEAWWRPILDGAYRGERLGTGAP